MIEVEVHSSLRALLRFAKSNTEKLPPGLVTDWPHHLTMARLVARALRLGRSALIQTGVPTGNAYGRYRLSYLAPALLWKETVILVTPVSIQQRLIEVEIPQLQQWLQTDKLIYTGSHLPDKNFQGLLLTSPESWLADQLCGDQSFPLGIPTIIDGADDLEAWAREQLTACIQPGDWDELMAAFPKLVDSIRDARVSLTKAIFQHPANPYECYLIEQPEQDILRSLAQKLQVAAVENSKLKLPASWKNFGLRGQTEAPLMWASVARSLLQFSLYSSPLEVATALSKVWLQQPLVLIGGALEIDSEAPVYRQQLGLPDLTCLKFSPDRQSELIQLYVPDKLPMPNTPQFQEALIRQICILLATVLLDPHSTEIKKPIVILIGDVPLKAQVATILASEFGSRVQVEEDSVNKNGILISGWEFWRQHQSLLPSPQMLIIATLPIPSLENPLVAGRVTYHKQRSQDWFRLYLLPTAIRELQRAIAPVRESQGVVAILDNRVNHRSYGKQVLASLSPLARINYPDKNWFRG